MLPFSSNLSQYELKTAYPTIALTVIATSIFVITSIFTAKGMLGIAWAIPINAIMAYLLFTPMHEAGHLNISGNKKSLRWVDEVIGWVSGVPLIAPFYIFKVIHFRHHAHTNDPHKDPDHWLSSKNLISLLFHSTTIFPIYMIKGLQLLNGGERITKKVRRELKIGFGGLFILAMAIIVAIILLGWKLVLLIYIIPAVIAQIILAITFDWLPHHPHEERARYLNTRIHDIPGLSFLLLGQNYHLIHHLYPRIPFYDYKNIFSNIKEELEHEGTEIVTLNKKENIHS